MKCFGFAINLLDDPEVIQQYRTYHQTVWPEVLENARKQGVQKTRIFLLGRRLFMYVETTDDFDPSALVPPEDSPRVQEWDVIMRCLQEKVPEAKSEEWWAEMELVHG